MRKLFTLLCAIAIAFALSAPTFAAQAGQGSSSSAAPTHHKKHHHKKKTGTPKTARVSQ